MVALWDELGVLGALTAAWLMLRAAWGIGRAIYVYRLPSVRRSASWFRAHGAWAVVTGATDGIGKAYAHELAKKGLNIVLISRNLTKLEREAKEIERLHGTMTRVIQTDFTGGLEIYGAIEEGLKGLEVGVLVNNVGMNYITGLRLGKTLDSDNLAQGLSDMVNCNMLSALQMTRIILPQMISRRRGIIINLSSIAENRHSPFLAVYSATKAFMHSFSVALGAEYASQGVTVQTVSPGIISTNLSRHLQPGLLVKSPEDWAVEAVHTLGLSSHTSGCLNHAIQSVLLSFLLPPWVICSSWGVQFTSLFVSWYNARQ